MSILSAPYTEPTTALRDWLRGELPVAGRVYANGLPLDPTLPAVVISRIGGGPSGGLDVGLYQFDLWAPTGSQASELVAALLAELAGTPNRTPLAGAVTYGGTADDPDVVWSPDPESDTPRYVVTAQVVTRTSVS